MAIAQKDDDGQSELSEQMALSKQRQNQKKKQRKKNKKMLSALGEQEVNLFESELESSICFSESIHSIYNTTIKDTWVTSQASIYLEERFNFNSKKAEKWW